MEEVIILKPGKPIAIALTCSLLITGTAVNAKQTKKPTIKTKKITMQCGTQKTIVLKGKRKKAVYLYKSSRKSIATISKKGKITAKKVGKAKITVLEKFNKKLRKIGTITVTITDKKPVVPPSNVPAQTSTAVPPVTATPAVTASASTVPTEAPTATPVITPEPTPTPRPQSEMKIAEELPDDIKDDLDDVTYGTKIKTSYYSTTTGKDRNVIVILPAGYTETKKYPVMYLFHGGMGDENDWIGGKVEYIIGNMIAWGQAKEMILVLPNCRCRENDSIPSSGGLEKEHVQSFDNFLNDFRDNLMPFINSTYSVAEGRENTAIAGLSMGGRVALNIGFHLTKDVGYIGAFTPAYGIFPYTNLGLTEEGLFTEETFKLPNEYKGNTLLMLNAGLSDNMVKDEPERYHNALTANGVDHVFYKTDGGHDWPAWRNGLYNFALRAFQSRENW